MKNHSHNGKILLTPPLPLWQYTNMKLTHWLKQQELTPSAFAATTGLAVSTITRAINGDRRPEWPTLDKISEATGGAVMPNDFVPGSTDMEGAA